MQKLMMRVLSRLLHPKKGETIAQLQSLLPKALNFTTDVEACK